MISYEVYKVVHFLGILMTFFALGALYFRAQGGNAGGKKLLMILHGVGLFLVLLGGFGLLARLGMARNFPAWAMAKLVIWVVFGAVAPLFLRKAALARPLLPLIIVLGTVAAYLAVNKPF